MRTIGISVLDSSDNKSRQALVMKLTAPQRGVLASFAFLLISMLSAQALAFDVDGLSYDVINTTDVEVTGRASGNTDTDIVIPATASDGSTTYSVTTIGDKAFCGNAHTSVIIGNSVTTIVGAAFQYNVLTSVTIPASVTTIEVAAFSDNALTSAHFGGNFGDFQLNTTGSGSTEREAMFDGNPNLTTITYCEGTTGWPQDFSNGSTTITATSIVCSPPDAPTIDSITPGAGQLTVAFTPGIDNGSPAYSYEASCLRVVGSGRVRVNVVGPTSPITVPSMYNGDTYECFVTATNIMGTSPASATSEPFVVGAPDTFDDDGDGWADVDDNCPLVANPQQEDADGDNVGDVCDNCLITPNTDQLDIDENGVGDLCAALGC